MTLQDVIEATVPLVRTSSLLECIEGFGRRSGERSLFRSRRAFSLIEALVAIVVLGVGMLGLGAASLTLLRQARHNREQALAAELAAARFERLAFLYCTDSTSGSEHVGNITSEWQRGAVIGQHARVVTQTVRLSSGSTARVQHYSGVVPCR